MVMFTLGTGIGGGIVSAGELLIMPADISHGLQAIERFKMLLIMIRGK